MFGNLFCNGMESTLKLLRKQKVLENSEETGVNYATARKQSSRQATLLGMISRRREETAINFQRGLS